MARSEVFMIKMVDRAMFYGCVDGRDFYKVEREDDGWYAVSLVHRDGALRRFLDIAETLADARGIMNAHQHDIRTPDREKPVRLQAHGRKYGRKQEVIR